MKRWRPGDRREPVSQMIRVDQAGEYGATRIYAGQLAVIAERGVRPTLLQPFWSVAGFALGAVTAAIGPEAAMACTAAVETEIDKHYDQQLAELRDEEPELSAAVREFQAEELEHKEAAIAHGAEQAIGYPVLSAVIRLGCRVAIAASKRI